MSDIEHVQAAGIRSAIIVDDGYDDTPQVDELLGEDAWESFFDDIYGDAVTRIEEIYPEFNLEERDNLKLSQVFIDALWQNRTQIGDLLGELFLVYEQKIQEIKPFLDIVESALNELGAYSDLSERSFWSM